MILLDKLMQSDFRRARFIHRFSGQYLREVETDSDHVWEMISLALKLIPEWNISLPDDRKLDIKNIIYRIVIHDLDECVTSDIPRDFKYHSNVLTNAIKVATEEIMDSKFSKELSQEIKSAKDHDDVHGFIVALFDVVQVGLKYCDEISNCGNNSIKGELLGFNIQVLEKDLKEIEEKHNSFPELYSQLHSFISDVVTDLKNLY